jgi:hypothetical protein
MKNRFMIAVYWSRQGFISLPRCRNCPAIITDGSTRAEALRNAEDMMTRSWRRPAKRHGLFQNQDRLAFA